MRRDVAAAAAAVCIELLGLRPMKQIEFRAMEMKFRGSILSSSASSKIRRTLEMWHQAAASRLRSYVSSARYICSPRYYN